MALANLLQQGLGSGADEVARTVAVNIQRATFNLENIARVMVLEGTAIAADLDQVILRTSQGELLLHGQQLKEQGILNQLPSRVMLQLRPGPNGLEAVLVVGNKPVNRTTDSLGAGTSAAGLTRQTLALEIPKIGQVHEVLVLPSTLFASKGLHDQPQRRDGSSGNINATADLKANISSAMGLSQGLKFSNGLQGQGNPVLTSNPQQNQNAQQQGQGHEQIPTNNQTSNPSQNQNTAKGILAPSLLPDPQPSNIRILTVNPPAQNQTQTQPAQTNPNTPPAPNIQPPDTRTATVTGTLPSGQPLLVVDGEGDNGMALAVKTAKNWPVGTQLTIQIGKEAKLLTTQEMVAPEILAFEKLREGLQAVLHDNPALFKEMANMRIPQTNAQQMGGALLFLFAALQRGDFSRWIGPELTDKLEKFEKGELIKKIREEWQNARFSAADHTQAEWKGINIPYFDQNKLHHFHFYIHDHKNSKNEKDDGLNARRFLIEVNLSKIGPLQMEGLLHKKKMDLVVRTDSPIDRDIQNELTTKYASAMEEVRYTGTLQFRANKVGWVNMKQKLNAQLSTSV